MDELDLLYTKQLIPGENDITFNKKSLYLRYDKKIISVRSTAFDGVLKRCFRALTSHVFP